MGVRFAASLDMVENFLDILYEVMSKMLGLNYNHMKISHIDKDKR